MKALLAMLLSFVRIGVGEPGAEPEAAPTDATPEPAEPELDFGAGDAEPAGDDPEPAPAPKTDPAIEEARRQADEARARADRAEREAADLRSRQSQANSEEARLRAEEDRVLTDPKADANEKWRIEANRRIRYTEQTAAQTAFSAADTNDRSNFSIACSGNKRLAYVKDQVEAELLKMRQAGQNAPRESIAYFLLGKMAANAKPKKQVAAAPSGPRGGKVGAGVRSDVPGKTSMSEREKRRARLENQPI